MTAPLGVRAGTLAAVVLSGATAAASPRTAELAYTGDTCPSADLVARVRDLVGRDPFAAGAPLRIDVAVAAGPRATVAIPGRGQRELAAGSCSELIDAIALVIAIGVDGEEPVPPRPPPPPRRARAVDTEDPMAVSAKAPPPAPARRDLAMLAGLAAGTEGTSGSLGVRLLGGRWSLEGAFELAMPAPHDMVTVERGGVALAACVHVGPASACPTAQVGWVTGRGHDLVIAETATTPTAAVGARLALEHAVAGRIAVRARIDGSVSLSSTAFTVDGGAVWETPRSELWFGIDVLARIP